MIKRLPLLLAAVMTASLLLPVSAADIPAPIPYAEAADGDLLWTVDFNAAEFFTPKPSETAARNYYYTIGDDGRSVTLCAKEGAACNQPAYWGGPIERLAVDGDAKVTMLFRIRANGDRGGNNSTGVGGWYFDSAESYNTQVVHNYSNWNSTGANGSDVENRAILCIASTKKANNGQYLYAIDQAMTDADGFMTCRMEFNGPDATVTVSYRTADGGWVIDEGNTCMLEQLNHTPDNLGFVFYAYPADADATVRDVQYFRGINLTDAQLSGVPESDSAAPSDPAAPAVPEAPAHDAAADAPPLDHQIKQNHADTMPDLTAAGALLTLLLATAAAVLIKTDPRSDPV